MDYSIYIFFFIAAIAFLLLKLFPKVYTISVDEFKSLFSGINDSRLIDVTARGPNHSTFQYKTYPIDIINCYDKKGNFTSLKNSPSLEIQFTDNNKKKTGFYFDLLRVNGNLVTGSQSRYASTINRTIDLNTIEKIEIRNQKKGFKYANKISILFF